MRQMLVLKVLVLVALLAGVLITIQRLNSKSVEHAFDALGIQAGTAGAPGFQPSDHAAVTGGESYNFCPNRIQSIHWVDGPKVEEVRDGLKAHWMASTGETSAKPTEIGYLEMEKWLSAHCKIAVKPVDKIKDATPFLDVTYIDGSHLKIDRGLDGQLLGYVFNNKVVGSYSSSDLTVALVDLRRIAQFGDSASSSP